MREMIKFSVHTGQNSCTSLVCWVWYVQTEQNVISGLSNNSRAIYSFKKKGNNALSKKWHRLMGICFYLICRNYL